MTQHDTTERAQESTRELAAPTMETRDYAIFLMDPEGRILTWNDDAQAIKGYTADEIIGENFARFFPPEAREQGRPKSLLLRAKQEGRATDQGWRVRKNGALFWADIVIAALHDDDGGLRGFIKVTRDLTERRKADELLRQSEQRLRLIVESLRDHTIFLLDTGGRVIVSWNVGPNNNQGYTAEDVLGKHFSLFYTEEDRRRGQPEENLKRAVAEGRHEEERWRVRRDGSLFWANLVITALRDRDGRLLGYATVTRDLTERRRAEEMLRQSEERTRLLIESVTDYAIFMLDPTGVIVTWNAGAQGIKGYAAREAIGEHFSMFYPEEERLRQHPEEALDQARNHGHHEEEGWLTRRDGTRFWASVALTAVYDPTTAELRGFSNVTRDLTAQYQAEHERLQRAKAEEAVRMRDEFLSIAAHELKTPLTSLQLQVSGVRRMLEKAEDKNEKLDARIRVVGEELDRFERLINELLDVSRARAGRIELTPERIELGSLVQEVVERFSDAAVEAGCRLSAVVRQRVVGEWDRLRLDHVLTNLVTNALKFGAGAPVEVTVGMSPTGAACIEVCDQGIGIEASRHAEIFERFVRAVSKEHYGGFGLGLWIVHAIVDTMGGSVGVQSAPGSGSTFTVLLPLEAPPVASHRGAEASNNAGYG